MGFTLLAGGVDVIIGAGMILAYKKYVAELDELQRKVYLNALAVTVRVAVIVGVPFSVLNTCGVIPLKADRSYLMIIMGATFLVSMIYGTQRYR